MRAPMEVFADARTEFGILDQLQTDFIAVIRRILQDQATSPMGAFDTDDVDEIKAIAGKVLGVFKRLGALKLEMNKAAVSCWDARTRYLNMIRNDPAYHVPMKEAFGDLEKDEESAIQVLVNKMRTAQNLLTNLKREYDKYNF